MNMEIDLIAGNTKRCLFKMVIPMMIAMYLNMAYNIVDSIWIGNLLGETAYAALTNSTPIILLLTSIAMGATNGISILLSQAIGAKDKGKTESLLATSLVAAIFFSLLVTGVLEGALPAVLRGLHTPAELSDMAGDYLSIYILGYIAVYLFLYFMAVLRSYGNSAFQAIAMLAATFLNAFLDPIFIRLFGFPGAAIASVLSQGIGLCFMLVYLWRKKLLSFHISLFNKRDVISLVQKAIPSVIQQSIPAVSTAFLTALVSSYGITAIAAYGISGKLETILLYPAMAFHMVLTTIGGQCKGGGRFDRAKDYLGCALAYGGGLLLLLSAVVVLFSKQLSFLFVNSADAAEVVSVFFRIVGIGYVFNMVTNCYLGLLNGFGTPSKSLFLIILYYIIIRMPLAYVLPNMGIGLTGIWAAILISHLCAAVGAIVMVTGEMHKWGGTANPTKSLYGSRFSCGKITVKTSRQRHK